MLIRNIENKKRTKLFIYPRTTFTPGETKTIFELQNKIGQIRQVTFEVRSNNNTNWMDTLLKIYVNDNNDTTPDFILSSNDIINGLGYTNTDRRMLDTTVYYFSNNRSSKVSLKLNFDFFKNFRIEVTAGNGNTTIGVWVLYYEYYYAIQPDPA